MSIQEKQLIISRFTFLPKELLDVIKEYAFHTIKKIPRNEERYDILRTISFKEYDPEDGVSYVYMRINSEKDYFLTYSNFKIQLQTLVYGDNNTIYGIDRHSVMIK